ncbi:paraquat-inducible protein A [Aestuariibacter salexigens]|uniref:paraquat-inducible protein A n=1 Tax=Aestuariibacter salexigens TaxID=226010 RepID=UPI00041BAFF7|nr:paraquat-inducible protein A [Aestuariibacter salexigens]
MQSSPHSCEQQVQCRECEFEVCLPELADRQQAVCPRCGLQLFVYRQKAQQYVLAFALSALVFLLLSVPYEFMSFEANGNAQSINLLSALKVLVANNYVELAIITGVAILALPFIVLVGMVYLLFPRPSQRSPYKAKSVLDWVYRLLPWSMAEIFLISVLVSLVKIRTLASIEMGPSFYAYVLFTLCMVAMSYYMDRFHLYQRLVGVASMPAAHAKVPASESIQRTWALLLTAVIFYIPANMMPIMTTRWLGQDEPSTIIGGVVLLWQMGSYPIAIVIFVASILVPVAKLITLAWLNLSVQKGLEDNALSRIQFYRVTEFIGRWSMVDVFVVAILVALIQLGNTMSIYPGPAALAFCAVVFITMLAAMTFDTRLIWRTRNYNE